MTPWRPWNAVDLAWYRPWFADPAMDRALGPAPTAAIDPEPGASAWVLVLDRPVGVLELQADPTGEHGYHGITGIAVAPDRRRTGLATRMIGDLLAGRLPVPAGPWVAFIAPANRAALACFRPFSRSVRRDGALVRHDLAFPPVDAPIHQRIVM
jgi:ribosomal protein S18 acetylase RimI-like enzyme